MDGKTTTATLALLCLYGFFKDMRPAVPFLTPFLRSDLKNFTAEEVDNEIYPLLSYSWMGFLLLVLLAADFVRYKPVLVVGGASYVATSVLWLWGERLEVIQIAQVVYGLATATETVYFSYIYVVVDEDHYKKATGYISFQVARLLSVGRYALVFGCNNLLALALQAAVVAIVVDKDMLNTGIRTQFLIYGGYFYMLAAIFLFKAVYTLTVDGWNDSWAKRWED
ncbi:SLC19A2 [Branchiostoma lanceolatum]|uniref:SLC19A2 protein n=1 Tax=Branchiostoma lanceolatum TaxID=7740 RepID=A0A8K0E436_BRALA|nr:SLC19A2 [Branchiostoma lanceolatum]